MPLDCGNKEERYRVKTNNNGSKTRLGFCGNKVVEIKSLSGKAKAKRVLGSK
jgi:hypothetical protein